MHNYQLYNKELRNHIFKESICDTKSTHGYILEHLNYSYYFQIHWYMIPKSYYNAKCDKEDHVDKNHKPPLPHCYFFLYYTIILYSK